MHISLKYEHLLEVYCHPPGSAGVQVTDCRVQTLGDSHAAHLALQHHVGVVEHRVHGVGGMAVVAACHRMAAPRRCCQSGGVDLCRYSFLSTLTNSNRSAAPSTSTARNANRG